MNNTYIFVLDEQGVRITSLLVGLHGNTIEECKEFANLVYPEHTYLIGTQEMQNEFLKNKVYQNGVFVEPVEKPYIPTKTEQIEEIKRYYDKRFETLEQTLARRTLSGASVDDLKTQYKNLQHEMIKKIKEVK